ncbi:hypothetical protein ASD64_01765 [Mesorhizobium sp. Root157]|uniref:lysoplasmalogenase family protein n=1 Tax=Mesorhizobium sp. Root157 TaxID=1736477 RepID=UPI0006FEE0DE|nr:lysoplasmalogenase family protein [Mesorhizobium sp. Root157]KRA00323.1 hypothetical protein ASD64_01765 [Mesorhizobium sp. Root157]
MMPFPGGIETLANATLIFSVVAAIGYAFSLSLPSSLRRSAVKTLAIGLLAVLAFEQDAPLLLAGALGLSAASDALSSQPNARTDVAGFVAGIAAFLAFGLLFVTYGTAGLLFSDPWRLALAAAMIALAAAILARSWGQLGRRRRLPALAYTLALLLMALSALMTTPKIVAGVLLLTGSAAAILAARLPASEPSSQRALWPFAAWVLRYTGHLAITLGALLG